MKYYTTNHGKESGHDGAQSDGPAGRAFLIEAAREAMRHAVADGFRVGAAISDSEGRVFTGCNIENPSMMLTICAERVALVKALSEGARRFDAIAIVSSDSDSCPPCGACRQALIEFAPGLRVYLESESGVLEYSIEDLLPHAFRRDASV